MVINPFPNFMVNKTLLCLLAAFSISSASGYFLEEDIPVELNQENARWSYGVGTGFSFLFNQFDFSLYASLQYRLESRFALGAVIASDVLESRYEFGPRFYWFFNLDDFLVGGVSGVLFEKIKGTTFSPRISLGYGKDFLPWNHAHFLLRTVVSISYLIGDSLESSSNALGVTKTNQVVVHGELSILFF